MTRPVRVWIKCASVLLVLALVVTALAIVAPRVTAGTDAVRPTAFVDSTFRVGGLQEPDSMNPFAGVLSASYVVWAHVYELLVGIGPDLTPVPALAQSWSVDAANLNWTFSLVQNATWHDSTVTTPRPFTAEDVNFTFRYTWAQTPGNPIGCDLTLLQGYLGDPAQKIGVDVDNITVLDPYTIWIPTWQPKANILSMFIPIIPKHIWSTIACNRAGHVQNIPPIGTGMYRFINWVKGNYIELDLYPDYWRLDKSGNTDYVDKILLNYYTDSSLLYNAFLAGALDATDDLTADEFNQMPMTVAGGTAPNVGKITQDAISFSEVGACVASDALISEFGKRGGRNWLVTNLTVRQALQHAVDREALVANILAGLGRPGSTLIAPATPYWHYNVTASEELGFDPDRARALLNDPKGDGYTLKPGQTVPGNAGENLDPAAANNRDAFIDTNGDGIRDVVDASQVVAGDEAGPSAPNSNSLAFTLSIINTETQERNAANFLVNWWSQVGIGVTQSIVTESRMISITYDCSVDLFIWGWGGDVDPDFMLSVMTKDQILYWQDAWYANSTYDAWYRLQQTQVDPAERQQTVWNMQRFVYVDAPYLIMWYDYILTIVRTDKFAGWGNWTEHPGLGLTGFGNDFVMLTLRPTGATGPNQCPTLPIIEGTPPRVVLQNISSTFVGNATDPEGDPLAWSWAWDDGNTTRTTTGAGVSQTSADHAWEFPGTYNVTLSVDDGLCGSILTSSPFQVQVQAAVAFGWINGTVVAAGTGSPIQGATVTASPGNWADTTNVAGTYSIALPPGTYSVTATAALYTASTQTDIVVTDGGTAVVDFSLALNVGHIAGTVTSSAGGAIAAATLRATGGGREYTTQTSAAGTYNLTVAPGTYVVNASAANYVPKSVGGVSVTQGIVVTVNFVLDPTGLSALAIAAIAAAALIVVALAAWFLVRRRKKTEEIKAPPPPPPQGPGPP